MSEVGERYQYSPAFRVLLGPSVIPAPNASVTVQLKSNLSDQDPQKFDNPPGFSTGGRNYQVYAGPDGTGRFLGSQQNLFVNVTSPSQVVVFNFDFSRDLNGFRRVHWIWGDSQFTGLVGRTDGLSFVDVGRDVLKIQQPLPTTEPAGFPKFGDNPSPLDVVLSPYTVSIGPSPFFDQTGVSRHPERLFDTAFVAGVNYQDLTDDDERENQNKKLVIRERGLRTRVKLNFDVPFGGSEHRDLETVYAARLARPTLKVFFALNYDAANPDWFEAQVLGDLPRTPAHGTNDRLRFRWEVIDYDPRRQVPGVLGLDGRGLS